MDSQTTPSLHRILIVDDVATVREALRWLFENEPDFLIVGEADNGSEAIHQAIALKPDLVLLDIELPVLDGYGVTHELKALPRPPIVILFSIHGDPSYRQRGIEAGSDGFVEKSTGWPHLIQEVRQALLGR